MKKLLLLVCLQTSMIMEGEVKQCDYSKRSNLSSETIQPSDNLFSSQLGKEPLKVESSKTARIEKTQWKPGNTILGKKRSKVSLRQINKFSYRSDRSAETDVPIRKVTKEQKIEE